MASLFRAARAWAAGLAFFLLCCAAEAGAQDAKAAEQELARDVEYLCVDVLGGREPDPARIAAVLGHVRSHPESATPVPRFSGAPGAYAGFPLDMPLRRLLRYLYNPDIPQEVLKPFSIRSSVWTTPGADEEQRRLWADPWPPSGPLVIRGEQFDRTTPDPSTGGCYTMMLRRAIVLLPAESAVLSISVQTGPSGVGTRGYRLGGDADARYVYSGEKGLTRTGLGWVSSQIQTNVSIAVYLETAPGTVVSGVFQWMRAGWSGLSVVQESHVAASLARYRALFTARLGDLPCPEIMEEIAAGTMALSEGELRSRARGIVGGWEELLAPDAPREPRQLLEGGYADRLDRAELVALHIRERLREFGPDYCASSGVQASRLEPSLPFQPRSTSR